MEGSQGQWTALRNVARLVVPCLVVLALAQEGIAEQSNVESLAGEASSGLVLLNRIRQNPAAFSAAMGVDLGAVEKREPLVWDARLAASAQAKAEDMARRNYVGHFSPEGVGPGELARRQGYFLPLNWPDAAEYNYIESISAGSARMAEEHIRNLIFDRGAPHTSPRANHRKHLLGMNKFWATHVHVGMGFAYNPGTKFKGSFVVHTGVPGPPSAYVRGRLFAPARASAPIDFANIWVGAADASGAKFWTRVSIPRGQISIPFAVRVPQQSRVIVRYFREAPKPVGGYYTARGTVSQRVQAEWLSVTTHDVVEIDVVLTAP